MYHWNRWLKEKGSKDYGNGVWVGGELWARVLHGLVKWTLKLLRKIKPVPNLQ